MSDTSYNIYVSAGSFDSPFFEFYIDASGTQELTPANTLYLDASYIFHRLDENTSHPFYISDVSYEEPSTQNITLSGDGSYNDGIIGSETFTLEFTGLDVSGPLYYYCTNHSSMVNAFSLVLNTPDIVAPTITSISPTLNATDILTNTTLDFFFSENVVDGSGGIIIYDASDNTIIQTIDGSDPQVSIFDNQVSVSLSTDLSYNTSFYVNIDAGAFQDSAGNDFSGLDSSTLDTGMRFTTEPPDIVAPTITSISPTLNATDILTNTNLDFVFSENVVDGSGGIIIYDASDNTIIRTIDGSDPQVNIFDNQVSVSLLTDLSYSTSFYVNIDAGAFQDSAGNDFSGLDSSTLDTGMRFTTEPPDIVAPTITSISPTLNATDILTNTNLDFVFSENVVDGSGGIIIYDASDNTIIQTIDGSDPQVNIFDNQVSVSSTNLSYNTSFYVNIDAGAFQDRAGNDFAGLDSSIPDTGMRFTTEIDSTIPFITDILPILNAIDVSANTNLEFTFSEDVVESSGNILIYDASDNTLLQTIDVSSSDVTISGSQVTVDPPIDLSYSTSFYVNIDASAFQDLRGNAFGGLDSSGSDTGMRFTVQEEPDIIAPTVTSILPILNATDISINSNLEFLFSEEVSGVVDKNIFIYDASDTLLQTIDVSSANVTISGSQVVINPSTRLPFNTLLYVNIDTGAFQDGAGNDFAGLDSSSNTGMRFTTEPDVTFPTLVSFLPRLNRIIPINANLVFTFSEDVVDGSGNIMLYRSSDDSLMHTFDVTSSEVTIAGSQVTVNPSIDLSYNTSFYVNIDAGAFQDLRGNQFSGLISSSPDTGMRFTTFPDITIPVITSISPLLNDTNVPLNTSLTITLSEDVLPISGNIFIRKIPDNTLIHRFDVTGPYVTTTGNQVVINPPTDFSYNTSMYVNIDSDTFQDLRGNRFTGLNSSSPNTGIRFTTLPDTTIPTITSFTPILNATDISVNTNLEFTLSEDVLPVSGNIVIHRSSNNIIIQVIDVTSENVSVSGTQVVVTLDRDLPYGLPLYVNIDAGAFQDLRGNPFAGLDSVIPETGIRFTTIEPEGDPDIIQPTITGISPVLNATDVQVNTQLRFAFSEQPILDVNGNIVIHRSSDNAVIQRFDVTGPNVNISGKQVVVTLPTYLPPNTSVYVNIGANALLDSAGNNFTGLNSSTPNTGMRFTTIDPATTRRFEIVRFCQDRKCQQTIDYNRLKTGGNDPTVSRAMRFSQYVRGNKASR